MLVLSRREGQQVVITIPDGREVIVEVASIRGDVVRIGFDADPDIRIHRLEVAQRIAEENGQNRN